MPFEPSLWARHSMGTDVATKIKEHQANKPVALTRKQKLAARDELKKLTETHAPEVIKTLAGFVKDKRIPASSRVAAGNTILERFAGKAAKPEDEKTLESEYSRMSEGQLLSTICDSIWGLSSNARAAIAETLIAAEQGVRLDTERLGKEIDEEAKAEGLPPLGSTPKPPRKEPRR